MSRRDLLAGVGGAALLSACSSRSGPRRPESLPSPTRPAGTPHPDIPIEHVIVLMMENHSFDNYFGMLGRGDGLTLDGHGRPTNRNSGVTAFRMRSTCQLEQQPSPGWTATHRAINGGRMDGFVAASGDVAMGYWDRRDIPFYYAMASTYALASRWFASVPGPTFPNRRFLLAGTAYGTTETSLASVTTAAPPHGSILDRLNAHDVTWADYYSDVPQIALLPHAVNDNPLAVTPIGQFYSDCASGSLPSVSFVDGAAGLAPWSRGHGTTEENPQDIRLGEQFVAKVIHAVTTSPLWPKSLLVWLYDEHGGYYDHVPPPRAVPPDSIRPHLYTRYGVRVPAVVVSPWAKPGYVSNVVHDHTSVLALIEHLWNLPALTHRDANANPMLDFLDFRRPRLLEPPALPTAPPTAGCST